MTIERFEDFLMARSIPLDFSDALSPVEMIGALKTKVNEVIDAQNLITTSQAAFTAWVDAQLDTHAEQFIQGWIAEGNLATYINTTLWEQFMVEAQAAIDGALADVATANAGNIAAVNAAIATHDLTVNQTVADVTAAADALQASFTQLEADVLPKSMLVGCSRIIVSETEPDPMQDGDLWIQPFAAPIADTTPPAAVSNLFAIPDNGKNILYWTNPADLDFAGVRIVRKSGSFPLNPTDGTAVYVGLATTYTDLLRTNGTPDYYAVYAFDGAEVPNYAVAAFVASTPADPVFTDEFGTFDYDRWQYYCTGNQTFGLAGSRAIASGATAAGDAIMVTLQKPLNLAAARTYTVKGTGTIVNDVADMITVRSTGNNPPTITNQGTQRARLMIYHSAGNLIIYARYFTAAGQTKDWNGGAWTTNAGPAISFTGAAADVDMRYIMETHPTSGFRFIVKSADGATTHFTTAWVPWSDVKIGAGDLRNYLVWGETNLTNGWATNLSIDSVTVA